jgi:hypothetical protein
MRLSVTFPSHFPFAISDLPANPDWRKRVVLSPSEIAAILDVAPSEVAVKYHSLNRDYDLALKIIDEHPSDSNVLVAILFKTAIETRYFFKFRDWVLTTDPTHKRFAPVFSTFVRDHNLRSFPNLRLVFEQFLGEFEHVASTAIELYAANPQRKRALVFLDIAQTSLEEGIRMKRELQTPPEEAESLLMRIHLQRQFFMFCMEQQLTAYVNLNLFGREKQLEAVTVLLLSTKEFRLSLDIVTHFSLNVRQIAEQMADSSFNEGPDSVRGFATQLRDNTSPKLFMSFIYPFVKRLLSEHDAKLANELISNVVKPPDFKCRLLIEVGRLEEAAKLAMDESRRDLIAFIAHLALKSQLPSLLSRLTKFMDKT